MDTSLCNANDSMSNGFGDGGEHITSDITPGFKDILSRWKDKDTTSHQGSIDSCGKGSKPLDITTVGRKMSREEAKKAYEQKKKESLTKSDMDNVDKSAIRNALRQPKNVYQQPLQHKQDFVPPTFAHTDAERDLIKSALRRNFVFSDLRSRDLKPLIAAFEICVFSANQTIISQGEPGDYFYVIQEGKVKFQVNDKTVGKAGKGNSFGELALLYTCPRAATVIASKETRLFRVDQMTFRFILQNQTKQSEYEKKELLRGVNFLKDLDESDIKKLSSVMTPRFFSVDDVLVRKGDPGDAFYVLQEGKVLVKDISVGSTVYEDQVLGAGEYFGERSLCTAEPRAANVVGLTRGVAFSIDRKTFEKVLGSMSRLILKAQDVRKLAGVSILQNAGLDGRQMASLAELITDVTAKAGAKLLTKGEKARAALYFVREGEVEVTSDSGTVKVPAGGYFGQCLMIDASKKLYPLVTCQFSLSIPVDSVLGMLTLSDCRMVFDTEVLGLLDPAESEEKPSEASQLTSTLKLRDLQRHRILGAGTFGQVWLVSGQEKGQKNRSPYALKIQSKSDLAVEGQIKAVIEEKNIMCKMRHPFISQLVQTYQDECFVYMLVELIQGGELFSIIHDVNAETDGVSEKQAKFYAFGVADALAYLHRAKYVFRDLKPENVMIDSQGYPKLIDFGFAKYVPDKTYTLCGTPGYLPPEVVMTRGHDCSADHWSLGILVYEMITGENPFYHEGMDQMSLFRSIVQDDYEPPLRASGAATDLIFKLLTKDPTQRIGSLARGEREIFEHEWFADLDRHAMKRKEVKAPWIPDIADPFDTSCFDNWDHLVDKISEKQPPLSAKDAELFKDF